MFEALLNALPYLVNPLYWVALGATVALAALVSLVPGMSALIVMALVLPFVVFNIEDPVIGIVLLAAITGVNNTLDSIPAILLGLPGGSTQVTYLEGHQLARQGRAAHTLGAVYAVSAFGGIVGALCLLLVIPVIRPFILSFGFSEIAAVAPSSRGSSGRCWACWSAPSAWRPVQGRIVLCSVSSSSGKGCP